MKKYTAADSLKLGSKTSRKPDSLKTLFQRVWFLLVSTPASGGLPLAVGTWGQGFDLRTSTRNRHRLSTTPRCHDSHVSVSFAARTQPSDFLRNLSRKSGVDCTKSQNKSVFPHKHLSLGFFFAMLALKFFAACNLTSAVWTIAMEKSLPNRWQIGIALATISAIQIYADKNPESRRWLLTAVAAADCAFILGTACLEMGHPRLRENGIPLVETVAMFKIGHFQK